MGGNTQAQIKIHCFKRSCAFVSHIITESQTHCFLWARSGRSVWHSKFYHVSASAVVWGKINPPGWTSELPSFQQSSALPNLVLCKCTTEAATPHHVCEKSCSPPWSGHGKPWNPRLMPGCEEMKPQNQRKWVPGRVHQPSEQMHLCCARERAANTRIPFPVLHGEHSTWQWHGARSWTLPDR